MSPEIKAQVQKVYEARQAKNKVWQRIQDVESLTEEWSAAVDALRLADELLALEQHMLANLLIESVLGKSAY